MTILEERRVRWDIIATSRIMNWKDHRFFFNMAGEGQGQEEQLNRMERHVRLLQPASGIQEELSPGQT